MQCASSFVNDVIFSHYGRLVQGGSAEVRPTYIFAGNIILVTLESIGKIQSFLANMITV